MKRTINLLIVMLLLISILPFAAFADNNMTAERTVPRLVDDASLLSDDEAKDLERKLNNISERQNLDVIIITLESFIEGYNDSKSLAEDIYEQNGFGMGESKDGILLLLSMEERDWAIATRGYGITVFTDAGQKYMVDNFLAYLSDGDYYKGFDKFADLADEYITQARTDKPFDSDNLPKKPMSPVWLPISIIVGALIAFIITGVMKSNLKSVSKQRVASKYLVATSMVPFANQDLYLYSTVTRTEKKKESDSPKTGSTTNKSSSGKTYGGSKGKF